MDQQDFSAALMAGMRRHRDYLAETIRQGLESLPDALVAAVCESKIGENIMHSLGTIEQVDTENGVCVCSARADAFALSAHVFGELSAEEFDALSAHILGLVEGRIAALRQEAAR